MGGVALFLKELMVAPGMVKTPTVWKHCSYRWDVRVPGLGEVLSVWGQGMGPHKLCERALHRHW